MELLVEAPFGGDKYETILGLRGAQGKVALLRLGDFQVELFEFASPQPRSADPGRPVCDHGITHFCLRVTDIHVEYARLKAAGVTFHCPPQDFAGALATYGRDPDGNVFELFEAAPSAHGGDTGGRPK
jgi:catechol 2,3-dioxygenase-like lactoylglutathione lyase family enzyme